MLVVCLTSVRACSWPSCTQDPLNLKERGREGGERGERREKRGWERKKKEGDCEGKKFDHKPRTCTCIRKMRPNALPPFPQNKTPNTVTQTPLCN